MEPRNPAHTPLVLLVDHQDGTGRSIERFLRPRAHVVLRAFTGTQAIDLLSKVSPDAILVDVALPDGDGIDLIRQLREAPTVHPTTPILSLSSGELGRAARLDALAAGAWDILLHPLDPNELIIRLDTFIRAKQEADQVRDQGLTDPTTGLYNVRGVLQRAREITADAARFDRPVTCIAIGHEKANPTPLATAGREEFAQLMADALQAVTRVCDTVGTMGPGELVIIAPGTDADGALRLVERVMEHLASSGLEPGPDFVREAAGQVRGGLYATAGGDSSPEDLLLRATMALRQAQDEEGSFRVRSFEA